MAELRIMGNRSYLLRVLEGQMPPEKIVGGDTKVLWDPNDDNEVEAARKQFDFLRKKGFNAYAVKGKDGKQGEQIREFDAEAGRIIMAPAMAGG